MDIHTPTACEDKEPFALQVIGESMTPEFEDGAVIIIDPGYPVVNGAYVLAIYKEEYHFRQLVRRNEKSFLVPLNSQFHSLELTGLFEIKGVITQQNHRRKIVHYEYPRDGEIERRESDRRERKKRASR